MPKRSFRRVKVSRLIGCLCTNIELASPFCTGVCQGRRFSVFYSYVGAACGCYSMRKQGSYEVWKVLESFENLEIEFPDSGKRMENLQVV